MNQRVEFALDNFLEAGYFEPEADRYLLEEKKESGRSFLTVDIKGEHLCIRDYDNKHKCIFVKPEEKYGMKKSVDHVIIELNDTKAIVHLIEMKSSISDSTWRDIKKKTRASYLNLQALAVYLGITIEEFRLYLTYERRTQDDIKKTKNLMAHMPLLGEQAVSCQEQWEHQFVQIKIDKFIKIPHKPIKMTRQPKGLVGALRINR